ncbi:MAG: two-component system response regulator NarL [Piscirickettsiaceae bacterium]|nr:MAG: two-component system response regulator NarL [Piscirickettsiaceae bacterium]
MNIASIMLVDDHPLLRKGLAQLISLEDHLDVICEASSGEEALQLVKGCRPDLILLDLEMKGMNGLDTLSALRNLNIKSKVVMLTVSDNETDVLQAIKLGADGYLLKDSEPEDIIDQLYKALSGELVLAPSLNRIIARSIQGSTNIPSIFNQLTKREMEVLKLITQGGSNKTIGNILSITEATVKVHVKSLLKKLNLRSRVEAAVWAIENKVTL